MRRTLFFATLALSTTAAFLAACGGDDTTHPSTDSGTADRSSPPDSGRPMDSSTSDTGVADTSVADTGTTETGVTDTGAADTSVQDSGSGGDSAPDGGCTTLTVKNYLSWCSVSVNGAPAVVDAVQTVCVPPSTVNLSASPASSTFELGTPNGPWHDTAGDTGMGDPGMVVGMTSSTTVVVGTTAACVWACCPFTDGTGCPTTNQCP